MDNNDPLYGVKGIYLLVDEYDTFSNDYLEPSHQGPWEQVRSDPNSIASCFWTAVRERIGPKRIMKCFITGKIPLSMVDHSGGFNDVATYISWHKEFSGLCGLSKEEVLAALRLPEVCKSEDDVQHHFKIMKENYGGYNFVEKGQGQEVFITNVCLDYLCSLKDGKKIGSPTNVSNWSFNGSLLNILSASHIATEMISNGLQDTITPSGTQNYHQIPYEEIEQLFSVADLFSDNQNKNSAWQSFMIHIGGLAFCRDCEKVMIPNALAAERFGVATLDQPERLRRFEQYCAIVRNIMS
ncbi:hypothetical protein BGZ46_004378 [Entomortierella lignicola]|nr:hypothetical protein BGZ46_004378 [Entomortierella lignicola]